MDRQHHQCNEHELGQTLEDGEGQGGLACYSLWGHKELNRTEQQRQRHFKHAVFTARLSDSLFNNNALFYKIFIVEILENTNQQKKLKSNP